jgi:hypothetical protein
MPFDPTSPFHQIALAQALADPSDPFLYSRVLTHLRSGVCQTPSDYSVSWHKEERTAKNGKPYTVNVPSSIKRL